MAVIPVIRYGGFPILVAGPRSRRTAPGELDSLTVEFQCTEDWDDEMRVEGYQHLKRIAGYASMWVESIEPDPEGSTNRVAIQCLGLLSPGEKRKRVITSAGEQISVGPIERTILVWNSEEKGEDADSGDAVSKVKRRVPKLDDDGDIIYKTIATPSGTGDRWDVRQSIIQVRDRYFTTARPATNVNGTVMAPPNAPTPPPYIWGGYDEPMRFRHPNGWVLSDRQCEDVFVDGSTGLWAVDDLFEYFYPAVPD